MYRNVGRNSRYHNDPASRGRGFGSSNSRFRSDSSALPMIVPSQQLLDKIQVSSTKKASEKQHDLKIKDVEVVGSYNWKENDGKIMLIPGKPPRWQPLSTSQQLHEDGGTYYRDPNSAIYPSFPTEPAVRAIQKVSPDFDLTSVSIFGCGNTVGSLLSFARNEDRTFRFGVELLGETLFLVRKTNKPGELIEDVRGYGHSFPEAYTSWDQDVRGSASHQRLVSYHFGGMKLVIRSECDGYLPELVDNVQKLGVEEKQESEDDINQKLLSFVMGSKVTMGAKLRIQDAGNQIPQSAVFDLKTRSIMRKPATGPQVDEFMHRLWVNQTPNMILAYHRRGTFQQSEINIVNVKDNLEKWEKSNSAMLANLAAVMQDLITVGKKHGRFEIRRVGKGPLEVWSEVDGWSALPSKLKSIWTGKDDGDAAPEVWKESSKAEAKELHGTEDGSDDEDYLRF